MAACIICVCATCIHAASHRFKGGPVHDRWDPSIQRSKGELEGGGCRAPSARTVRIMHRARMRSACGTNLAPECLRMDGIVRSSSSSCIFSFSSFSSLTACLMHVCIRYSKTFVRVQSTGATPPAKARELTSHEEVSLLSLLFISPLRRSLSHLQRSLSSSSFYHRTFLVWSFSLSLSLSCFPSYRALFQSLVVAVYCIRRNTRRSLWAFCIKETPVLARRSGK